MGNFWANKLARANGPAPRAHAPAHPAAPPTAQPWWAPTPTAPPAQPQQQVSAPAEEVKPNLYYAPPNYMPNQAKAVKQEGICPDCQQPTLTPVPGMPSIRPRCTACGWPVVHSTSGMNVPTEAGVPATPARQVSTANNYNPGMLIASVKSL